MKTKRAFLMSLLSLVLCLAMLVGSTFAWFTDSASTAVNKIVSGNLKVDLQVSYDGLTWESADKKTLDFVDMDDNDLWEPGCTYELPMLRVVNEGNLALKYQIVITGIKGDAKLNEAIEWTYNGLDVNTVYSLEAGKASDPIVISGHMDENAGNDYQNLTIDGIAITVYATQYTHEYDSFDNQYDKYADRKFVEVANQAELEAAIAAATEPTVISMAEGTYTIPAFSNKDIVFMGTKDVTIDMPQAVAYHGATLTFDGINVAFANVSYVGFQHTAKVVYDNCTITGQQTMYAPEVAFVNCTLENRSNNYCVWTYGATDATFTGCTFNTSGKAILVYTEGETHADITVDNCVFNDDEAVDLKKAAVEVGSSPYSADTTYNITISNTTVIGFAVNDEGTNTNTRIYGNKNSMDADHLSVVINNVNVVDSVEDIVEIATAEELFAFANDVNVNKNNYAGKLVLLTADIDLENKAWTPIGQTGATEFKGVFDGNGHTISNLTVNNTDESKNCSSGLFGWIESHGNEGVTVKNLTVKGATVSGHHYVGVIVGYVYGTIENCHVVDATVSCTAVNDDANGDKAGTIAGYVGEDATIKGCTATDSTISAGRDAGQIVGAAREACVTECAATNVAVTANGTSTGANIRNEVIGRVL